MMYIYSYVPTIIPVQTDAQGTFSYNFGNTINDGVHTVYIATTDANGRIIKKSTPFSLFIKEAQAVTKEEFLNKNPLPKTPTPPTQSSVTVPLSRYSWRFAIGLLALLIGVGYLAAFRSRQRTA